MENFRKFMKNKEYLQVGGDLTKLKEYNNTANPYSYYDESKAGSIRTANDPTGITGTYTDKETNIINNLPDKNKELFLPRMNQSGFYVSSTAVAASYADAGVIDRWIRPAILDNQMAAKAITKEVISIKNSLDDVNSKIEILEKSSSAPVQTTTTSQPLNVPLTNEEINTLVNNNQKVNNLESNIKPLQDEVGELSKQIGNYEEKNLKQFQDVSNTLKQLNNSIAQIEQKILEITRFLNAAFSETKA